MRAITNPNDISHTEMVKLLAKNGLQILAEMTSEKAHLWHMATGISGEAGEILDAIKKHAAYNLPLTAANKEGQSLRTNLIEELGDLEFYMEGLRQALGVSRELTLLNNKQKLFQRYPGFVYTNKTAKERADKL